MGLASAEVRYATVLDQIRQESSPHLLTRIFRTMPADQQEWLIKQANSTLDELRSTNTTLRVYANAQSRGADCQP